MKRSIGFINLVRGFDRLGRIIVTTLLLALTLGSMTIATVGAQGSSLATDHSEVIAQGIDTLSGTSLAWRVVQDETAPAGEGTFEERALGFAVATDGTVLLTDEDNGARVLLQPGEAAFTREGTQQARESMSADPTPYLRIGLVDESEANNGNGNEVLYGGTGFAAPSGDFEIELIGVKLDPNESTQLPASGHSLVLVTDGTATVGDVELGAGEATTVDGAVQLQAQDSAVRAYVATIGDQVASVIGTDVVVATQTPAITADDGVGRIIVLSEVCPAGITAEQAQATESDSGDPCFGGGPVSDMTVQVTNTGTGDSISLAIDPSNASAAFQNLEPGNYDVNFATGDGFGETVGNCGGQDQSADLPSVALSGNGVNLDLPADREYLCVTRTVQFDQAPETGGVLSATFFACPIGMTFDTLDTTQCTLITDGFDFGFQDDVDLHLADAVFGDGTFVWDELAIDSDSTPGAGYYSPVTFSFPDGYDTFGISTDGGDVLAPNPGGYQLSEQQQGFTLTVYFFSS